MPVANQRIKPIDLLKAADEVRRAFLNCWCVTSPQHIFDLCNVTRQLLYRMSKSSGALVEQAVALALPEELSSHIIFNFDNPTGLENARSEVVRRIESLGPIDSQGGDHWLSCLRDIMVRLYHPSVLSPGRVGTAETPGPDELMQVVRQYGSTGEVLAPQNMRRLEVPFYQLANEIHCFVQQCLRVIRKAILSTEMTVDDIPRQVVQSCLRELRDMLIAFCYVEGPYKIDVGGPWDTWLPELPEKSAEGRVLIFRSSRGVSIEFTSSDPSYGRRRPQRVPVASVEEYRSSLLKAWAYETGRWKVTDHHLPIPARWTADRQANPLSRFSSSILEALNLYLERAPSDVNGEKIRQCLDRAAQMSGVVPLKWTFLKEIETLSDALSGISRDTSLKARFVFTDDRTQCDGKVLKIRRTNSKEVLQNLLEAPGKPVPFKQLLPGDQESTKAAGQPLRQAISELRKLLKPHSIIIDKTRGYGYSIEAGRSNDRAAT